MNAEKDVVIALLNEVIRAVRQMSPDEFEQLCKGKLRLPISVPKNSTKPRTNDRNVGANGHAVKQKKTTPRKISEAEFPAIRAKLDAAKTREAGHYILRESFNDKSSLYAFSRYLDVGTQSKDSIASIQDSIVGFTVDHRLEHNAIMNYDRPR